MFFLLLPFGVKLFLVDWLEENGADQATVEWFWYNPLTSGIILEGVDLQKGGKSLLSNSKIELDFDLLSLFRHDIHLQKVEYKDLAIELEQNENGNWRIGTYTLVGENIEKVEAADEEHISAWAFLADMVSFSNCSIVLKMDELNMRVDIQKAELINFTTRAGGPPGTFSFKGAINQAPVELKFDTISMAPSLNLVGNVSITKLSLADFAPLLKEVLQPFSGVVGLDGKFVFIMSEEKSTSVEYDGNLDLADLAVGNSSMTIESQGVSWQGRVSYIAPSDGPMHLISDGFLTVQEYGIQLPEAQLTMKESLIELNGLTSLTISDDLFIENTGTFLVEGFDMELSTLQLAEESLLWNGNIRFSQYETGGMLFDSTGELALGRYNFTGKDASIPIVSGGNKLVWQGKVAYGLEKIEESPSLKLDGKLNGEQLSTMLTEPGLELVQNNVLLSTRSSLELGEEFDITGSSSLSLDRFGIMDKANNSTLLSLDNLQITGFEGLGKRKIAIKDISLANLMVSVPGNLPLEINIPEVRLRTVDAVNFSTLTVADFRVKTPVVTSVQNGHELVRLESLALNNIFADTAVNVQADTLLIDNVLFLPPTNESEGKPVCSLANARLTDFSWSGENGLHGGSLTFQDLVAAIVLDKDKNLNISHRLDEMRIPSQASSEDKAAPEAVEEQAKDAAFSLREIAVTGESRLVFEDHSPALPYITDLAISHFHVGELDSRKPEQKSELVFKGELEKRAPLEIVGYLSPFQELPVIQLELKLKNYQLASFSPYTVQAVGTGLLSGQLQLDTKFALAGDELDMENTIILKKLKTEMISPELAAELDNELPLPLDAALTMLRDKDENITLAIPLSGAVSDLNVGISDILITALGKAIVPAASGYLMYALGPYGALAYIGMKVGEKMMEVTLPPVVFARQESTLTAEHADYLERIAKILQERPAVDIQICPSVGAWEFLSDKKIAAIEGNTMELKEKDEPRLAQLGQERAAAVKNHLATKYAINESRLLICDTLIEKAKNSVPAVHLNL